MSYYGGTAIVPEKAFHEIIWERLEKFGNETAIVDDAALGDKSVTYLELHDLSKKSAAFLQSLGVQKGDCISLCVSGSIEFAFLMLGIMGSGGIVAPCNPSYRKNEILQQFNISRPRFAFVDAEVVETMKSVRAEVTFLEQLFVVGESSEFKTVTEIMKEADPDTLKKVDIDPVKDIACAPHSSGTTGLPKCALMSHKSYVAMWTMERLSPLLEQVPRQTFYCDRPMYHSGGFGFLINHVAFGVKVIARKRFRIDKMLEAIEKYRITTLFCVPPMLLEMVNTTKFKDHDVSTLKMILFGGAATSHDVIRRTIERYSCKLIAVYGMTEGGFVSSGVVSEDSVLSWTGKVKRGVEVKITEAFTGNECGFGCDGEIIIKSPQVLTEYLNNPSANDVAFSEDGWFRTGDIGRLDEAGNLYVLDRLKQIIKYKAMQVSPAELESVIISHPKVSDVGVVGIPDEMSGELPKAFVVRSDSTLTDEDIHAIINDNLVEYKHLRGGVEFVASIPKSETGKIQRNELRKMSGL